MYVYAMIQLLFLLSFHTCIYPSNSDYVIIAGSPRPSKSTNIVDTIAAPITAVTSIVGYLYHGGNSKGTHLPKQSTCKHWTARDFVEHMHKQKLAACIHESQMHYQESGICYLNEEGRTYNPNSYSSVLYAVPSQSQREILQEYHVYWNNNYLNFVKQFPEYEPYILGLHKQLSRKNFFSRVKKWWDGKYITGLKDVVAEQAASIERDREQRRRQAALVEKQRVQEQQHKAYQERIEKKLGPQLQQERAYYNADTMCLYGGVPEEQQAARKHALEALQEKVVWSHQSYTVTENAQEVVRTYEFDVTVMRELDGHQLQHVIHKEFIKIIETTAEQPVLIKGDTTKTIIQFVDAGVHANVQAHCLTAVKVADFCWNMISAACEGVKLGVQRAIAPIIHPLQTAQDLGASIKAMGHVFNALIYDIGMFGKYSSTGQFIGGIEFMLDDIESYHAPGRNALFAAMQQQREYIAEHEKIWVDHYEHRKEQIQAIAHVLSGMSAEDVLREGVALVVDAKVATKLLTAMSGVLKHASNQAVQQIKKIKSKKAPLPMAVVSEGLHLSVMEEALTNIKSIESKILTITEAEKLWEESKELQQLQNYLKKSKKTLLNKPIETHYNLQSNIEKIDQMAEQLYSKIRLLQDDVNKIAKNTGISSDIIKTVKNHVFCKEHNLWNGFKKFDPNLDIAQAWLRFMNNEHVLSDVNWILHEYAELLIMKDTSVTWRIAHDLTSQKYKW